MVVTLHCINRTMKRHFTILLLIAYINFLFFYCTVNLISPFWNNLKSSHQPKFKSNTEAIYVKFNKTYDNPRSISLKKVINRFDKFKINHFILTSNICSTFHFVHSKYVLSTSISSFVSLSCPIFLSERNIRI